jgi:hypothetical protein
MLREQDLQLIIIKFIMLVLLTVKLILSRKRTDENSYFVNLENDILMRERCLE